MEDGVPDPGGDSLRFNLRVEPQHLRRNARASLHFSYPRADCSEAERFPDAEADSFVSRKATILLMESRLSGMSSSSATLTANVASRNRTSSRMPVESI